MTVVTSDLEAAPAEEVLAYAIERFHPRLTMACSFQKEESVLVHMLTQLEPSARVFTIDTGVLFPETLETWKRFEERFGVAVEVIDARSPDAPWVASRCCGAAEKLQRDERRGIWKVNPIADWTEKDLWRYIHKHDLPYHPLHDQGYSSIGCAPCTQPGDGREGRWSGTDKTELHV